MALAAVGGSRAFHIRRHGVRRRAQARHRPRRDPAGDRRLGYRRAAGRAGAAARFRLGQGGRGGLHGQVRRLPRRVRRERRALAAGRRRRGLAQERRSGEDGRVILRTPLDRVRLRAPRDAVWRRAVAEQRRALRGRRLHAVPQRHRGREIRAVEGNLRQREDAERRRLLRRRSRDDREKNASKERPREVGVYRRDRQESLHYSTGNPKPRAKISR